MAMLPSQVGIKKPETPQNVVGLIAQNPNDIVQTQQKQGDKMVHPDISGTTENVGNTEGVVGAQVGSITQNDINLTTIPQMQRNEIDLSPNPSDDVATLRYALKTATDLTVEVLNEAGQIVASYQAKQTQFGSLNLDTHQWASGIYMVHIVGKELKEVKRLVVQH